MMKLSRGALCVSLTAAACLCGVEKARAAEPFTDIGAGLTGVDSHCSLAWGDYDSDGDLDLALAGHRGSFVYISKVYRNDGGGTFTNIGAALTGVYKCSLVWGDCDTDGDLDLALAGDTGGGNYISKVYRNDGGAFTDIGAGLTGVSDCSLAWGDYDTDGDLDLALAGGWYDGSQHFESKVYRNDGGTFTDINAGLTGVWLCSLAWGDYDNDGDLDLALAGSIQDFPWRASRIYRNDGGTFTAIGAGLTAASPCSLAWGDYDNDGDLDLALAGNPGAGNYISKVYRNNVGVPDTPPSAPASLSARVSGPGPHDVRFSWTAATDAETPQPGLTYNLRVGTTPGGDEIMSGMAIVGGSDDAKRLVPAMGNCQHDTSWTLKGLPSRTYYWSVQAVDAAFAGSSWATERVVDSRAVTPFAGGCVAVAGGGAAFAICLLAACLALGRGGVPTSSRQLR